MTPRGGTPGDPGGRAAVLADSDLARMGGAAVARVVDEPGRRALLQEAAACAPLATPAFVAAPSEGEGRSGCPDRWLDSAPGGPRLRALYRDQLVLDLLSDLTGLRWRPSGLEGSYSYYRAAGQHLGLHRDVEWCDLAVITCIADSGGPEDGRAGSLRLYPDRADEPLAAIRATEEVGAVHARLRPGESLILLGGWVPHRVLPVAAGQRRVVAPLCYTADG